MVTETAIMQASHEAVAAGPEKRPAEALWRDVERSVAGAPLAEAAPRCEAVRRMAYLHCWALCHASQQCDIEELWAAEGDVEEFAGSAVVEPIKEIARHMMWGVQEESATGPAQVHLRTSSATNFNRTHLLCEQSLQPQLGKERSEAVWSMCQECAWEVQYKKQRHPDDEEIHRLWAEHYARRMGFDDGGASPRLGNHAVVALCHRLCRHWTSANATDGAAAKEELRLRQAAFEIALREARELVVPEAVDVIVDMQAELKRGMHLNRLMDRKNPGQFVSNLLRNTSGQERAAFDAARRVCDELLVPLLGGERAEEVFKMCNSCSWHEQNRYDYESSMAGRLTGAREGYLRDAEADWASVLRHSALMGFDDA